MSWKDGNKPTPCNNCDRRQVGCHSRCQEYIKYREMKDEDNILLAKDKEKHRKYLY